MSCLLTGILLTVIMLSFRKIMCIKLSSLCQWFVIGCLEFGWVVSWVESWVQSFHFAMGWVSRLMGFDELKKLDPPTTLVLLSVRGTCMFTQAYERRGQVRLSAVWSPRTTRQWAAGHKLSKYAILNRLDDYRAANVPLACETFKS